MGRVRCWFAVKLLGVISSTDCCNVIGQDISFVLVVGTGNSVVFQNRYVEESMVARETFNLLPGHGEPKVTRYGAAEFLPTGLFGFKNDSPRFSSRAFKIDNVCVGSRTLHAKISIFFIFDCYVADCCPPQDRRLAPKLGCRD